MAVEHQKIGDEQMIPVSIKYMKLLQIRFRSPKLCWRIRMYTHTYSESELLHMRRQGTSISIEEKRIQVR
ncbi:hypothetical protein ARMGADRAFT_1015152 [Armillaria gallica]|uniref:Uncharacterized protein n=1 Tax=Armillaria gallica TaxID=47427 RepID=A0A2H3DQ05_ARMGA|nr:hypothetical protein ARMGADRAFT_1015152 [Armillaria gallica]